MKPKFNFFRSVQFVAGLLMVVFVSSCGSSYENASVQNDGIYATDAIANENSQVQNQREPQNSDYYQNYFDEQDKLISQARTQNDVFTDIDSYSSQGANDQNDDVMVDENDIQYNSYGGWGTQPTSVTINYIDNGFYGPFGGGFYGPYGGGFYGGFYGGFGPWYGPYNRIGFGFGGLYGGFGWGYHNAFVYGNPYWGGFGYGFGYGYGPYYGGINPYNGYAFQRGTRNSGLALNRGRSNLNNSRGVRSNQNIRGRSTSDRSRLSSARSNRSFVNSDGRRIRNSSNVNARTRNGRVNDRSTTTRQSSRSRYSNQSINRNSNTRNNSTYRPRTNTRSNNRSYTPRTNTRSTRSSSSRVRSSSRSSSSRSSGRSSSRRGGRR